VTVDGAAARDPKLSSAVFDLDGSEERRADITAAARRKRPLRRRL